LNRKNIDIQAVKTEWAAQFLAGGGLNCLVSLINNTDFNQINNFLFMKTILLLFKTIRFYDVAYLIFPLKSQLLTLYLKIPRSTTSDKFRIFIEKS